MGKHNYTVKITWTGNKGDGTNNYNSYSRDHNIIVENKIVIPASSDPHFKGDATKYNPEELFLASLSSCHMLWYLHLCADNGVRVTHYTDTAKGTMEENSGGGKFTEVILYPQVTLTDRTQIEKALALHDEAHRLCYIANSCNFPVKHLPGCIVK